MSEATIDWTQFTKRIQIDKPVEQVYKAWATSGDMEQWFLERSRYLDPDGNERGPNTLCQAGDHYIWKWNNWNHNEEGLITEANGFDLLSFTFGSGGNVHLELKEKAGGTEIILTQDHIPTEESSKLNLFVGCSVGWAFWLTNLKAWMEHAITLHATGLKQEETKDLVNS